MWKEAMPCVLTRSELIRHFRIITPILLINKKTTKSIWWFNKKEEVRKEFFTQSLVYIIPFIGHDNNTQRVRTHR